MHASAVLTAIALIAGGVARTASAAGIDEPAHTVPGFFRADFIVPGDPDGDDFQDFVFVANRAINSVDSMLVVYGRKVGTYQLKQAVILEPEEVFGMRAARGRSGTSYLVIYRTGLVVEYGGWPLRERNRFQAVAASATAVADLDLDGDDELVLVGSSGLAAYDPFSGTRLWNMPGANGASVAVGSFDFDPEPEIAVAGNLGLVIEPSTQSIVGWNFPTAFRWLLDAGRFGAAGEVQFVGNTSYQDFAVFDGRPWQQVWSMRTFTGGISVLRTADADGDGRDEIVQGDDQHGDVHVFDTVTRVERLLIENPGSGTFAIGSANTDGDAAAEIAFAPTINSSFGTQEYALRIVDGSSAAVEHDVMSRRGTFSVVAIGDVDADGQLELIVSAGCPSPCAVFVVDFNSGVVEWESPSTASPMSQFYLSPRQILLTQTDADAANEVVLVSPDRVLMIDGATRSVQLQLGTFNSGPFLNRRIVAARIVDADQDGTQDLLTLTTGQFSNPYGPFLQAFSLVDGHELWATTIGPQYPPYALDLVVANADADPELEYVVVYNEQIRSFDPITRVEDWRFVATGSGATFVPHGMTGPEIAIHQQEGAVAFYDLATRQFLRAWALPSPVDGVRALGGRLETLLVCAGGRVGILNARSGRITASSPYLGRDLCASDEIALAGADGGWNVSVGGVPGYFRFTLDAGERIFADGFEPSQSGGAP